MLQRMLLIGALWMVFQGASGLTGISGQLWIGGIQLAYAQEDSTINAQDDWGDTKLHYAVSRKDTKEIRRLCRAGASPNIQNKEGNTPFHRAVEVAVRDGKKDVLKELLRCKPAIDVFNKDGYSPAHMVFSVYKSEKVVRDVLKMLFQYGVDPNFKDARGRDLFVVGIIEGMGDKSLNWLLDQGVRPDLGEKFPYTDLILNILFKNNRWKIIERLIKIGANLDIISVYIELIRRGDYKRLEKFQKLARTDSELPYNGNAFIHLVIRYGSEEFAEKYFKQGANVNLKNKWGLTPLHYAAYRGFRKLARLLLKKGANLDETNSAGKTPLFYALEADKDRKEMVEFLLQQGANPNIQDNKGNTPLHIVVQEGRSELVPLLLQYQANVNIKNDEGLSPFFLAIKLSRLSLVDMLKPMATDTIQFYRRNPLFNAIFKNDLALLKQAYESGVAINSTMDIIHINYQYFKVTPLWLAVFLNYEDIVKQLIQWGADVNKGIVKQKDGSKWINFPPLIYALSGGDFQIAKLLIEAGADINHVLTEIYPERRYKNISLITALMHRKNMSAVDFLLNYNPDLNKWGTYYKSNEEFVIDEYLPMVVALGNCNVDLVRKLLEKGSNPRVTVTLRFKEPGYKKERRITIEYPLLALAIRENCGLQMIQLLVARGANPFRNVFIIENGKERKLTVYQYAKNKKRMDVVAFFDQLR